MATSAQVSLQTRPQTPEQQDEAHLLGSPCWNFYSESHVKSLDAIADAIFVSFVSIGLGDTGLAPLLPRADMCSMYKGQENKRSSRKG